jgi:hypothetical protein
MVEATLTTSRTSEAVAPPPLLDPSSSPPTCQKCTSTKQQQQQHVVVPQDILFPAYTNDYRVVNGQFGGLGMVANRFIAKGEMVLSDSIEFLFADVQQGDHILLVGHDICSQYSEAPVPARIAVTRDMLIRTHGVPVLQEDPTGATAGIESWRLEVPWMLLNHSCDPNVVDSSHKEPEGEAIAARDIQKGEELTYDYTFQYYDRSLHSFHCLCGASNCRKLVTGFEGLEEADKERLWPLVSEYIRAKHFADTGTGPMVREMQQNEFPPRSTRKEASPVVRLMVPGPSCAASDLAMASGTADVAIKACPKSKTGYALYANRDFALGEEVYQFWNFIWPTSEKEDNKEYLAIDMVSATHLLDGDLPEGTVIRVNPLEHGMRDSMGRVRFSVYDMLTAHSCEPNLVYNYNEEDEDDDWRTAFAAQAIRKGELLTIDFNTVWWDRSIGNSTSDAVCLCGAAKCRGTMLGYHHLAKEHQDELKMLSWRRVPPPYAGEERIVSLGDALSPHIHVSLRKEHVDAADITDETDISDTSSSASSSFADEESDSSSED